MAVIKAFKGILYDDALAGRLKNLVAPPYDVISPAMRDELYERSPYNIIRLILGKDIGDKYANAARFLKTWLKKGILVRDKDPSIYIYRQTYLHEGKMKTRTGFIALMKLEDPSKSGVLPHEYTLAKPKKDRLKLLKKVKANLSPIFSLYYEKKPVISKVIGRSIGKEKPFIRIDSEGVIHEMWRVSDKKKIDSLKRAMKGKKIFIADGHHRYEVALQYKKMMKNKASGSANADYIMMYFANLDDTENITILSTHRVLKDIGGLDAEAILSRLRMSFDISKKDTLNNLMAALAKDRVWPRFGAYMGKGAFYLASLKKRISAPKVVKCDKSPQWKRLHVAILHNFVINNLLSLQDYEDNIKYVKEPAEAVRLVDRSGYKIAFILNPTRVHEVKEVALKGDMMPQKSTYFYPKLLAGLVINKF